MTYYDRNVIVEFLSGSGDTIITSGSQKLKKKVGGPIVTIPPCSPRPFGLPRDKRDALKAALGEMTGESRLYLRGHGDWTNRTMGGWSAKEMAGALNLCGLTTPKLISVTGCKCSRSVDFDETESDLYSGHFGNVRTARETLLANSTHSFAGLLHRELAKSPGVRADVVGRVYSVDVDEDGSKVTVLPQGHKKNHRHFSKIRFYWEGAQQRCAWVEY